MIIHHSLIIILLLALLHPALNGREWTSNEGRQIVADFVSATSDTVTLKRTSDGQVITIPLSRFIAADQAHIREIARKPAATPAPLSGPFASLITGEWALSEYRGLPFALYGPENADAKNPLPIILALHGRSDNHTNGQQVKDWMKAFTTVERFSKNPCFIFAPLGYQPHGGNGSAWNDKPGEQTVTLLKELLKTLPIDRTRVYCIGYSMGGYGTCHLIERESRLFAVAGCAGTGSTFKKVPLWLFHAADDGTVSVQASRDLAKSLERIKDFRYTEYPTGGHGIVGQAFETPELHEWLFAKRQEP